MQEFTEAWMDVGWIWLEISNIIININIWYFSISIFRNVIIFLEIIIPHNITSVKNKTC